MSSAAGHVAPRGETTARAASRRRQERRAVTTLRTEKRPRLPRRNPGVRLTARLLTELCEGNEIISGRIMEYAGHEIPHLTEKERERRERDATVRALVDSHGYDEAAAQMGLSRSQVEKIAGRSPEGARRAYLIALAAKQAKLTADLAATERAIQRAGGLPAAPVRGARVG